MSQPIKNHEFYRKYQIFRENLFENFPFLEEFEHIRNLNQELSEITVQNMICLKLTELWQLLIKYRPKSILELGPGWTTFIFDLYCKKYDAIYYGFEESEEWLEKLHNNFKKIGLSMPSILKMDKKYPNLFYEVRYDYDWDDIINSSLDFIYIDGPANTIDGKEYICSDGVDFCDIERFPSVKAVVFDIRNSSFDYCDCNQLDYIAKPGYFRCPESAMYHNVLERISL